MSRIRTGHRPEDWAIYDDGASPSRHNKGIRGASFENPIQVSRAVGESSHQRDLRLKREWGERARAAK